MSLGLASWGVPGMPLAPASHGRAMMPAAHIEKRSGLSDTRRTTSGDESTMPCYADSGHSRKIRRHTT